MIKLEKNINAENVNLSAGLLNDNELSLICGGTAEEGQAVVDLILSATSDHAITVDCCVKLQKFYAIQLDSKGNFDYLILQAYIKDVITQNEYIAAKWYYIKIKS